MSSSTLKIIACTLMLIDHIGAVLFPDLLILRIIGRLAFPMFAYFVAEGYRKTRDITNYMGRLFVFALISQVPFDAAFLGSPFKPNELYLNVLFTLGAGLYAIYAYDKYNNLFMVVLSAAACQIVNTDYGAFGVIMVFLFYRYYDNFTQIVKKSVLIMAIFVIYWLVDTSISYNISILQSVMYSGAILEPIALFSLIFIKHYNGKRGLKLKYIFYAFYPVHLLILSLISLTIK